MTIDEEKQNNIQRQNVSFDGVEALGIHDQLPSAEETDFNNNDIYDDDDSAANASVCRLERPRFSSGDARMRYWNK